MTIFFESRGNFNKLQAFLEKMMRGTIYQALERHGAAGVLALASATPMDTGQTAYSWTYEVKREGQDYTIVWSNTNINAGVNIAVILQVGHGTGTGGYVAGYDYINPALRPIFDQIADDVWKEVQNA